MKFKKDSFVKWTAEDDDGSFNYVGRVVRSNAQTVTMHTSHGLMTVAITDGTFTAARRPKSMKHVKPTNLEHPKASKLPKAKRVLKAGTVKAQVFELLKGKTVTRKEAIAMIVEAGLSSPAGASTHFNSVKDLI